jgi:ribosomal protein S18 acetylase RimI-like enzyme
MKPSFRIEARGLECLDRYSAVPIGFTCDCRFEVELIEGGMGGMRLVETPVDPPEEKDFDLYESPLEWPKIFDPSHFQIWLALVGGTPVGGAALVWDTPSVHMLDDRRDLAVLWDIRVHPAYRGQGVGRALFSTAVDFARDLGLRQMKIETQNNNVAANRFYHAMGARLGGIRRFAYAASPEVADEVMLLWYLELKS